MRIKDGFVLQIIADEYIVVPIGADADRLHGIIKLNESGAFLWNEMKDKDLELEDIVQMISDRYHLNKDQVLYDAERFIEKLTNMGCLSI